MPNYNAPIEDLGFVLRELIDIKEIAELPGYEDASTDVIDALTDLFHSNQQGNTDRYGKKCQQGRTLSIPKAFSDEIHHGTSNPGTLLI